MKCYMIAISGNETSEFYSQVCKESWEKRGYTVEHFEAVVPETIPENGELTFGLHKGRREFTATERAIWYSHFNLWKHCVETNEAIHVIEHDSFLLDEMPDFTGADIELFAIFDYRYKSSYRGIKNVVSPCAGYYISPEAAKVLIEKSTNQVITLNVDWTVHETYDDYHLEETGRENLRFQMNIQGQCVVQQLYIPDVGTTIEHR